MSESFSRPVAVVGGGVVGLSLARELAVRGARQVTVLERDRAGSSSESGAATTASLGVLSIPFGKTPFQRLKALGHSAYPELARLLLEETGIDIGYRVPGSLYLEAGPLEEWRRARAEKPYREAGISCRWLLGKDLRDMAPDVSEHFLAALHFPDEALVDPALLRRALRASCEKHGVKVREGVGEARLQGGENPRIELECGEVISEAVVVLAAGAWTGLLMGEGSALRPLVKPIRGQAMEVRSRWNGPNLRFRPAMLEKDYHVVAREGGTAWVGATVEDAGFDARVTEEGLEELFLAARDVLPAIEEADLVQAWAGLRPKAMSRGGPFLGRLPGSRDVWVAAGHYRSGILMGPISARLLAAEITGDEDAIGAAGFDREAWSAFRLDR